MKQHKKKTITKAKSVSDKRDIKTVKETKVHY